MISNLPPIASLSEANHPISLRLPTIVLSVLMLASGCQSIPAPTLQVETKRGVHESSDGLTAPLQKLSQLDADRWFEAAVDHRCYGEIRFVDQKNGIDSFVEIGSASRVTLDSDDSDVVLGTVNTVYSQLVFSTNGGRQFVKEVRGLPRGVEFVAVRKGHVYVGINASYRDSDGYFKWRASYIPFEKKEKEFRDKLLVILEAKLDKANGKIGKYVVLAPKDYQFETNDPSFTESLVKRVDYLESLNLPHIAAYPAQACSLTMQLPVWHSSWDRKDLNEFVTWYQQTKQKYPGWGTAEKDAFVQAHLNTYKNTK
ncbi:hypothetical protein INH39_05760 [Massilia violaceinigra]|uniref:DUF4842 domain-containing protein n=1 Tax=Massilia violaceinigra TaxID=2045208 RepID=A0ABY4AA27_9BURK|nr:hypothetical protein [Massilia violaceinigra]UOD31222.1 hypothetical protein INH39_05760 [Massilia violaceinigra]